MKFYKTTYFTSMDMFLLIVFSWKYDIMLWNVTSKKKYRQKTVSKAFTLFLLNNKRKWKILRSPNLIRLVLIWRNTKVSREYCLHKIKYQMKKKILIFARVILVA